MIFLIWWNPHCEIIPKGVNQIHTYIVRFQLKLLIPRWTVWTKCVDYWITETSGPAPFLVQNLQIMISLCLSLMLISIYFWCKKCFGLKNNNRTKPNFPWKPFLSSTFFFSFDDMCILVAFLPDMTIPCTHMTPQHMCPRSAWGGTRTKDVEIKTTSKSYYEIFTINSTYLSKWFYLDTVTSFHIHITTNLQ